jgi:hypothetical protein
MVLSFLQILKKGLSKVLILKVACCLIDVHYILLKWHPLSDYHFTVSKTWTLHSVVAW